MRESFSLANFFVRMAYRQFIFLMVVGAGTIFFALYFYGMSWTSGWIMLAVGMIIALLYGLTRFWQGVFQSMLERKE